MNLFARVCLDNLTPNFHLRLHFTSESPTPQTEKSLRQCDILGRWLSITSKPVFFSVIEDDEWATAPHLRRKADTLKREPYDLMLRDCPYPSPLGVESVRDFAFALRYFWDGPQGLFHLDLSASLMQLCFALRLHGGQVKFRVFRHIVSGWIEEDSGHCCVFQDRSV